MIMRGRLYNHPAPGRKIFFEKPIDFYFICAIIIIVKGRGSQKNKIACGISTGDLIKKILETKKNPLTTE
jgi:hypothetical protein